MCSHQKGCIDIVPYSSKDGGPHIQKQDPIISSADFRKILGDRYPDSSATLRMEVSTSSPQCPEGSTYVKNPLTPPSEEIVNSDYCSMTLNLIPGSIRSLINDTTRLVSFKGLTTQQIRLKSNPKTTLPNLLAFKFTGDVSGRENDVDYTVDVTISQYCLKGKQVAFYFDNYAPNLNDAKTRKISVFDSSQKLTKLASLVDLHNQLPNPFYLPAGGGTQVYYCTENPKDPTGSVKIE